MSDTKFEVKENEVEVMEHQEKKDANRDPITGEPGAHPIGVAGGGVAGAAAGAAVGAIGGPVGAVVGGVVGAVAGGLAGKAAGEAVDPTVEDAYWRENYKSRPYYKDGKKYEDYQHAYRYGWQAAIKPEFEGRPYEDVESELERTWPSEGSLAAQEAWASQREATRDAYNRIRNRTGNKK